MAAPMTSSDDLPVGICSAVTCSVGCAVFHASTTCLPQAISCSLLEYQILIGPCAVAASLLLPPPPELPQAVSTSMAAASNAAATRWGKRRDGRDGLMTDFSFVVMRNGATGTWQG